MKIKNFYEPVYNTHLLFIYDCKPVEAENYLNEKNIQRRLRGCTAQTGSYKVTRKTDGEQSRYYIYIEKDTPDKELRALVHEIAHLIFMSLSDCGIYVTRDTDEIFAYYFDWWFGKLYPLIK